jgi:hypothetical protein
MVRTAMAALLSVAVTACTAFEPQVGPSQESCGVAPLGSTSNASGAAPAYGKAAGSTTSQMTCGADAGSACDDCESQFCCTTRLACYDDPVCTCADHATDGCLSTAGSDAAAIQACWDAFVAAGTVEASRVACERAWCQAACGVP